jgi:hypothetical protein
MLLEGITGTPKTYPADTVTQPGQLQTMITINGESDKTKRLYQAFISCDFTSFFKVYKNGDIIGSGRTGAGYPKDFFTWVPAEIINDGDVVVMKFKARAGSPVAPVEAFIQTGEEQAS